MNVREFEEVNTNVLKRVHVEDEVVMEVLKCIQGDKSLGPDQLYNGTLWDVDKKLRDNGRDI